MTQAKRATRTMANVTRTEFDAHTTHVDQKFESIERAIVGVANKLDNLIVHKSATNWSAILGALSIATVLAGMGGALVANSISSETRQRELDIAAAKTIREVENKYQQSDIFENRKAIGDLDTMMQREARLLDEVLQREMSLHVKRIDDLIDRLTHEVENIKANRFTNEDATRLIQMMKGQNVQVP